MNKGAMNKATIQRKPPDFSPINHDRPRLVFLEASLLYEISPGKKEAKADHTWYYGVLFQHG